MYDLSHQITSLSNPFSVTSPSSFFFPFTQSSLFSLTQRSPSLFCVALERESKARDRKLHRRIRLSPSGIVRHVDLEIGSFTGDISLYFAVISLFWVGSPFFGFGFFFFCSALFFFFFGDVGFGCGFPVHSFGFFVWLLVVLMVVESRFVVGGGDETGFGCGFHVIHVESHG